MRIIDSHAHYDDSAFEDDRSLLLDSLFSGNVDKIINVGCSLKGSQDSLALSEKYDRIYAAVGLHPDAADEISRIDEIKSMCGHKKVVAVGEIGLDYHYENHSRELQKVAFEQQLRLAAEVELPVIIHSRDACADTMELLKKYRPKGVMHCFSGSAETAGEIVSMGMYVGFTGAVTFKNAKKARKALELVPLDRLLVETDCPYMSPEPLRGRRSDSGMIIHTLGVFAEIKGVSPEEIAEITARNAERLFGLEERN